MMPPWSLMRAPPSPTPKAIAQPSSTGHSPSPMLMTPIWKAPPSPSAAAINPVRMSSLLPMPMASPAHGTGTGVLTLSGSASKANYETAFESITYQNTNTDDPDNTDRTVTWVVNDGTVNSSGVTSTITVADANDAPVVSDAGATLAYTEGDSATVIDGTSPSPMLMTPIWKAPPSPSAAAINPVRMSSLLPMPMASPAHGTGSGGVLTLSGSASKANYETAFESITYQNTNTDDPDNTDRTVTWVVNDGTQTPLASHPPLPSRMPMMPPWSRMRAPPSPTPKAIAQPSSTGHSPSPMLMTPIWKAPPSPSAAAIKSSEDVLAFTNANGITGILEQCNGVLTLSGSASKGQL